MICENIGLKYLYISIQNSKIEIFNIADTFVLVQTVFSMLWARDTDIEGVRNSYLLTIKYNFQEYDRKFYENNKNNVTNISPET